MAILLIADLMFHHTSLNFTRDQCPVCQTRPDTAVFVDRAFTKSQKKTNIKSIQSIIVLAWIDKHHLHHRRLDLPLPLVATVVD